MTDMPDTTTTSEPTAPAAAVEPPVAAWRRPVVFVLLCVLLALVLRLIVVHLTVLQPKDSYLYLDLAQAFAAGDMVLAREINPYLPPVLPALMGLCIRLGFSPLNSGIVISVLANLSLIPLVYLLGRRFFARNVAEVATVIFLLHPMISRYSVMVMRDSFYFALAGWGAWLIYRALATRRLWLWMPASAVVALAICTRREAWELPMAIGLCAAVAFWRGGLRAWRPHVLGVGVAIVIALGVLWPLDRWAARHDMVWRPVDVYVPLAYVDKMLERLRDREGND